MLAKIILKKYFLNSSLVPDGLIYSLKMFMNSNKII